MCTRFSYQVRVATAAALVRSQDKSSNEEDDMEKGELANEYLVSGNELVTIRVRPIKVGRLAVASNPAKEVTGRGDKNQVFTFKAKGSKGDIEGVVMSFTFPKAPPPRGKYEIEVEGSEGGGPFPARTVRQYSRAKKSTRQKRALLFELA
jgi:hypothetical protein